jgi:hypothetical protein
MMGGRGFREDAARLEVAAKREEEKRKVEEAKKKQEEARQRAQEQHAAAAAAAKVGEISFLLCQSAQFCCRHSMSRMWLSGVSRRNKR